MSKTETSLINLSFWNSGKRKIRYLYLVDNNYFSVTKNGPDEGRLIPLFLGADLYSDTDIRIENHPRYHAKFAKKGLATKLVFSSEYRFHGLRVPSGMNSLWFYSIQGIFRVAFELYRKQQQLSILESFQDLWKSRLNDDLLKMTYQLTVRLDSPQNTLSTTEQGRQTSGDPPDQCVHCPQGGAEPFESTQHPPESARSEDHDYCSPVKVTVSETPSQPSQVLETLKCLENQLQSVQSIGPDQKHILLSFLKLAEHCTDGGGALDEEYLAKAVLSLLQLQTPNSLSIYCSPLLQAVAGWLGRCFHAANSCISQQVESFKVRHIEHISDLPPSEELAAELFPEAMRTLLVHWMGLSEEAALWKRHSEFPILLLILEFANHNLITGVAHVLYSSLICK
ncbi:uncharacterized protein si:ch211-110p13.9 [Sardina pilchardus]|uniref:uncharacterized protein si:ch211-110p13.9 n=1 Tax=Sardina pilchardus TaxID=27697 RepID=UPI002E1489E4